MKRLLWISGVAAALLGLLLLTGWAGADDRTNRALRQGNEQYTLAEYEAALSFYEAGLEAGPESGALRFNAAQAAYMLGDFAKAAEHYENAGDSVDKYLNAGNIFYWTGDAAEDANEQAQCYEQALAIYQAGILLYPQDIPLKYNYETVRALLEELQKEMEQESEGEDGESGEEQGEDGEQGEGQSEGDQNQNSQGEESDSGENAQSEQDEGDDQNQSAQQDENAEQDGQSGENQDEGQEDSQEAYAQEESAEGPDQEAIERILAMLESQEAESLKNNQGVVVGKDETNGW